MSNDVDLNKQTVEDLRSLRQEEIVDYIRETVVRLDTLADRLESYISDKIPKETG